MKLIVNMVMGIVVVGLVEVMVMVEKVGLDQEDVVEVFLVGVFSCLIVIYKSFIFFVMVMVFVSLAITVFIIMLIISFILVAVFMFVFV